MKLRKIEVSSHDRSNGRPVLTVSKSGKFSISPAMREKIGYKKGLKINFFQDEEVPKNWYITLNESEGVNIREAMAGKYLTTFIQKATLADTVRRAFGTEEAMLFSIGAATELAGVNYWPLLYNK